MINRVIKSLLETVGFLVLSIGLSGCWWQEQENDVLLESGNNPSLAIVQVFAIVKLPIIDGQPTFFDMKLYLDDPLLEPEFVDENSVKIIQGMGFVYDTSGKVLTNAHLASNVDAVFMVKWLDGREESATIVDIDQSADKMILQIEKADSYSYLNMATDLDIKVGDQVFSYDNQFVKMIGEIQDLNQTIFLRGQNNRKQNYDNMILVDFNGSKTISGCPVLNNDGKVIGMSTAFDNIADMSLVIPLSE